MIKILPLLTQKYQGLAVVLKTIKTAVETKFKGSKLLTQSMWKNVFPKIQCVLEGQHPIFCTIKIIDSQTKQDICSITYQLHTGNYGKIQRIKQSKKVQPLNSAFFSNREQDKQYYYKMFKSTDFIKIMDTTFRDKAFLRQTNDMIQDAT